MMEQLTVPATEKLQRRDALSGHRPKGWTPLHYTAAYGQVGLTRFLLDNGADIEVTDGDGLTPLDYAARYGHSAVVELLTERGARHSLYTAAAVGALSELRALLAVGSAAHEIDPFGLTPLHWAAWYGREQAVAALVEHGVNCGLPSRHGETALSNAREWGHQSVVHVLHEACETQAKVA